MLKFSCPSCTQPFTAPNSLYHQIVVCPSCNLEFGVTKDIVEVTTNDPEEDNYEYAAIDGGISIRKYVGDGGDVLIPATIDGSPVVEIENRAFADCSSLTSITCPDSVTSIGERAFCNCANLVSVSAPGCTSLGKRAFAHCPCLKDFPIELLLNNKNSSDPDWTHLLGIFPGMAARGLRDAYRRSRRI